MRSRTGLRDFPRGLPAARTPASGNPGCCARVAAEPAPGEYPLARPARSALPFWRCLVLDLCPCSSSLSSARERGASGSCEARSSLRSQELPGWITRRLVGERRRIRKAVSSRGQEQSCFEYNSTASYLQPWTGYLSSFKAQL